MDLGGCQEYTILISFSRKVFGNKSLTAQIALYINPGITRDFIFRRSISRTMAFAIASGFIPFCSSCSIFSTPHFHAFIVRRFFIIRCRSILSCIGKFGFSIPGQYCAALNAERLHFHRQRFYKNLQCCFSGAVKCLKRYWNYCRYRSRRNDFAVSLFPEYRQTGLNYLHRTEKLVSNWYFTSSELLSSTAPAIPLPALLITAYNCWFSATIFSTAAFTLSSSFTSSISGIISPPDEDFEPLPRPAANLNIPGNLCSLKVEQLQVLYRHFLL